MSNDLEKMFKTREKSHLCKIDKHFSAAICTDL